MSQSTITIGYQRQWDGDIAVLATLSNIDELLEDDSFELLIRNTVHIYRDQTGEDVRAWEREDAPAYLNGSSLESWADVTPQ